MKLSRMINYGEMFICLMLMGIFGLAYATYPPTMTYDAGYSLGTFNGSIVILSFWIFKTFIVELVYRSEEGEEG